MNWVNNRDTIFENGVINIFCDASIRKLNSGETLGSPGAVCLLNDAMSANQGDKAFVIQRLEILRHSTNNHAEIYAIYMAYQLAKLLHYEAGGNPRINIYSDSQISVYGLRDWIFSWVSNSRGDILTSSTGKSVANQDIYKMIVIDMIKSGIPVHLYHTKGHVNTNSNKSLINAKRVFDKSNNTNINLNAMSQISYGNDLVDLATKDYIDIFLRENNISTNTNSPIRPYYISLADIDMDDYKNILGGI